MTVAVQRLTDDNTFETIGRVDDGEILEGEDELLAIDDAETWERLSDEELADRFNGPHIIAGILDDEADTESEAVGEKSTPEGVPDGYEYVAPDEEVGDEYDVVESPAGGTYRSPEPVDEEDRGGSGEAGRRTGPDETEPLGEGDPRRPIDSVEEGERLAAEFDEDAWEFDYWNETRPYPEDLVEGSVIEVDDGEFALAGDGEVAVVADAEEGLAVTESGEVVETTADPGQPGSMLAMWEDPSQEVSSGEKTWDDFGAEFVPEDVRDELGIELPSERTDEPDDYEPEVEQREPPDRETLIPEESPAVVDASRDELRGRIETMLDESDRADVTAISTHFEDEYGVRVNAARLAEDENPEDATEKMIETAVDIEELAEAGLLDGIENIRFGNNEVMEGQGYSDEAPNAMYSPVSFDIYDRVTGENPNIQINADRYREGDERGYGRYKDDYRQTLWHETGHHLHKYNLAEKRGINIDEHGDEEVREELLDDLHEHIDRDDVTDFGLESHIYYDPQELAAIAVEEYMNDPEGVPDEFIDAALAVDAVIPGINDDEFDFETASEETRAYREDTGNPGAFGQSAEFDDEEQTIASADVVDEIIQSREWEDLLDDDGSIAFSRLERPDQIRVVSRYLPSFLPASEEADAVESQATPEGVPDGYEYLSPGEEPPEGHETVESPAGATYVSPEPVEDTDTDESDASGDESESDGEEAPPDPPDEDVEERGREVEQAVGDILGPDPGNEEFAEAEAYLEDEVSVDDVDFSSLDAAQVESASRELGRMDALGSLDGIESFRFSIPEDRRSTQGTLPAHYDRDGRGISVDPSALDAAAAERLHDEGVTSTARETHMMEHAEGQHAHAENVEEGHGEADGDETLEEAADEAGVDISEVASYAGQLAMASTATMVAETYVMAKNGHPTPGQVGRLYRFLGGPTIGDLVGAEDNGGDEE